MTDQAIEDLVPLNYSLDPKGRVHEKHYGEKSGIRLVDVRDQIDMRRMKKMEHSPSVNINFIGGEHSLPRLQGVMEDQDLIDWTAGIDPDGPFEVYAVAGSDKVPGKEKGEFQGWVGVYELQGEDVKNFQEKQIVSDDPQKKVVEIAYAALPGAEKGQMGSAVRQVCAKLLKDDNPRMQEYEKEEKEKFERELKAKALPLEDQVRERQKFEEKIITQYTRPHVEVIAFIRPDNEASRILAEKCGFEATGTHDYGGFQKRYREHVAYTLNWDKLMKIMHEKADPELLKFAHADSNEAASSTDKSETK